MTVMKLVMAQFLIISGDGVHKGCSSLTFMVEGLVIMEWCLLGLVLLSTMQAEVGCQGYCQRVEVAFYIRNMLSETDSILLCNEYLGNLGVDGRGELKKLLVELKRQQEETLFDLEKQYLRMVAERRTMTVSALKSHAADKSFVGEPLRSLVNQNEVELQAFMKIRVHGEWQAGQMIKQRDRLIQFGVPEEVFSRIEDVKFTRELLQLIWDKCNQ